MIHQPVPDCLVVTVVLAPSRANDQPAWYNLAAVGTSWGCSLFRRSDTPSLRRQFEIVVRWTPNVVASSLMPAPARYLDRRHVRDEVLMVDQLVHRFGVRHEGTRYPLVPQPVGVADAVGAVQRAPLDVARPLRYSAGLDRVRELARKLSACRKVTGVAELLEHIALIG